MKIVICDDEKGAIEYLEGLLREQADIEIIGTFTEQKEFQRMLDSGKIPDVVFMDIDWKDEQNGIQLSSILFLKYPHIRIIYVTGYNDRFSQQIFLEESNLCGYLVKPVQEELLNKMLNRAQEQRTTIGRKILVNQRGVVRAIPYNKIFYLESKGHRVIMHMENEIIQITDKLDSCRRKMPYQFIQCHKSFVVNMDYIVYIDKKDVWLESDAKVPISKSYYKKFRESYFKYMGEKM